MRKFFHNDTSIRVISVLISILLWMYVVGVNNPTVSVILKGIPVQITNNEKFDSTGLKVISVSHKTIDVKIEGRHSEVSKVSAADIEATVDVSSVLRAGTFDLDIKLNSADNGVTYTNVTSEKARIYADFVIAVNKDIEVETSGTPKEGFAVESVTTADTKILVRGPKSVVGSVSKVSAFVDITGADGDISKSSSFKITNTAGKEIDMTYVTTNITETLVDVKFTQVKEVKTNPVIVNPELLADYELKAIPETVKIIGSAGVVKSVSVIDTQPIEIAESDLPEEGSKVVAMEFKLPEGVSLAEGVPAKIEMTITAKSR